MNSASTENTIKAAYEAGEIYKSSTICAHADRNSPEYARRQLWEKIATYTRTGVVPHPGSYFEGIAKRIAPSGASWLMALLTPGGEPIAYHNTVQLGPGACYHTGCSRAIAHHGAGYLLMWEAIKAAKRAGALWFDCDWIFPAATDNKQQGLTLFKTRFGGEPHRAFRAELGWAQASSGAATAPSLHLLDWTKLKVLRRLRLGLIGKHQ